MKINKNQIARELDVNRKTVDRCLRGFQKSTTKDKSNCLMDHLDTIKELLSDHNQQIFYYKRVLWQYLVDNHHYLGSYTNFVKNLRKYPELNSYFRFRIYRLSIGKTQEILFSFLDDAFATLGGVPDEI